MEAGTGNAGPARGAVPLTVTVQRTALGWTLGPVGELDHDTAGPFADALDAALRTPRAVVVVDCAGLGFCDSTGLNLLLRARTTAVADGSEIVIARPTPMIERMLAITGTGAVFRVVDTVEAAGVADGTAAGGGDAP
ncbi:STAS domain-containing protein [Kitasatospora sp. NBC_01539]|uniref:STAS domain-containing protein n=1 Tax=Kitasatospora sp. NBC_01539 TaxID=2903577 RepID=UPI0038603343